MLASSARQLKMEEQQEKITVLVDDNRWLRKRVLELEAMLGQ